ncbi:DSBA oxidoreductase [Zafaria cholistanensis]|uniref:DSBA oxidoreductase n=1 Tax=Zafaria cholistanensis TaxID=1682741 RepID=A0A5A7NU30_9MICC|nr:DsbA family oxidoreductase [Zafaria cholistanensis]GER23328.1 DSBA oxidoreductase [Zafaria cholistanensis]
MNTPRLSVDIWSDIACPWCFIGKRRFEKALDALPFKDQVDITWHAYQLDPSLPEHYEGSEEEYLAQVKGLAPEQVRQMLAHVTEQAAGEGLSYDFASLRPANSFTALRLLALAKEHGLGNGVKEALLSAHFERGLDTGNREVLRTLGEEAGLPAADVVRVLESDAYAEEVRADIAQARALGITGVPFFVLENKYGVSGAQPPELFEQALTQVWDEIRGSGLTLIGAHGGKGHSGGGHSGEGHSTHGDGQACGPDGCA